MKELQDVADWAVPYLVLFLFPVLIALSPCEASADFPVHRLAHFELGGALFGAKVSSLSMDARPKTSTGNVLRKIVVARVQDVSVAAYNELAASGAGALLLLVPERAALPSLAPEERETVAALEEHALSGAEMAVPVFYATDSPELRELLDNLEAGGGGKKTTGAQAFLDSIVSNGYQLATAKSTPAVPKPLQHQDLLSIEGLLRGTAVRKGEEDSLPTVVLVAHYDAGGAAPGLAHGADANGSGVSVLMEMARVWGHLYKSARTRPGYNLLFVLTNGGHANYLGTRKWLDEVREEQSNELLSNVAMVVCVDSVGGGDAINAHVSKPPKGDTHAGKFVRDLKTLAEKQKVKVDLVHKKINLASESLLWEHERFSIAKLPALTLSRHAGADAAARSSLLDVETDDAVVARNARLVGEALACALYEKEQCAGNLLQGALDPARAGGVAVWRKQWCAAPRHVSDLLVGAAPANKKKATGTGSNPLDSLGPRLSHSPDALSTLATALRSFLEEGGGEVRTRVARREKRDPEWTFFEAQSGITMTAYRVKPAVFDLVLTACIAAYLGLVYAAVAYSGAAFKAMAALALVKNAAASPNASPAHKNGYANGKTHKAQ